MTKLLKYDHPTLANADNVKQICQKPLFDRFGIHYYQYGRVYKDGSLSLLGNQANWIEQAHNKHSVGVYSCVNKEVIDPHSYFFLWDGNLPEGPVSLARNEFDIANGLCLVERHANYYDLIAVATPKDRTGIVDIYMNNLDYFKQFAAYFRDAARDMFAEVEASPMQFPTHLQDTNKNILLKKTNQKIPLGKAYVTKREYQSLTLLAKGYSVKSIAQHLALSPRTVETYLQRIKDRYHLISRKQLVDLIHQCQTSSVSE